MHRTPTDGLTPAELKRENAELTGGIHHSDRGSKYTSHQYFQQLVDYGLQSSMSAQGNCYDNAAKEFFGLPSRRKSFQTRES
jgi:transposase InsO family protein